VFCFSR